MTVELSADPGTVAVLGGAGPEGSGLVLRWAAAGIPVAIGSRNPERAASAAQSIREQIGARMPVEGYSNLEAAEKADTVVLAVPFAVQLSLIKDVESALTPGKLVIDLTVPLASSVGGRPTAMLGIWHGSAAQQAASAVPRGVIVASAFHNTSAHDLEELGRPLDCDVLVCSDNRGAKERIRRLVEAIQGCRYVDAGPLANSRIVESITALLIGINIRYKVHGSGIRITGVPELG